MTSIYRRALGEEFDRLHPEIQRRFGFDSDDGVAAIGRGTMEFVENGGLHTLPFLYTGTVHNIMFPEEGTDVPFTVRNYAYRDAFDREVVTWIRRFELPKPRRFDAGMIFSEGRDRIVDYLGNRHHLAVDVDASVHDETRGMYIETDAQRLTVLGRSVPFPRLLTGEASVHEWYDDDDEVFKIEVSVRNALVGTLFRYRGEFAVEWIDCEEPPEEVLPAVTRRHE